MQTYETVLILSSGLNDQQVAEFVEKTRQSISADGGEIVAHELWGRRKLTHPIGKAREGVYAYFKFRAAPPLLKKLAHAYGVSDSVLRDMTVVVRDRKMREKKPKKARPAAAAVAQA